MEEQQQAPQDQTPQDSGGSSPAGALNTDHMIPKARLDEVLNERNTIKQQFEELQRQIEDGKRAELEKKEEFRTLYEETQRKLSEVEPSLERAKQLEQAIADSVTKRIEQIPEELRSLVPDFGDPVKVGAWLDANADKLQLPSAPKAPGLDGGSGSNTPKEKPLPVGVHSAANTAQAFGYTVDLERIRKRQAQR